MKRPAVLGLAAASAGLVALVLAAFAAPAVYADPAEPNPSAGSDKSPAKNADKGEKKRSFPAHPASSAGPDAGTAPHALGAPGFLPDPDGLVTRNQWILDLAYQGGAVSLRGARRVDLGKPLKTPRMMGRFAVELYVGRELIDRVRFDFPLLGAAEEAPDGPTWNEPPSFERQLHTRTAVMVPASDRITRAVLVDRASARAIVLPWPPDSPQSAPPKADSPPGPADAGAAPAKSRGRGPGDPLN